MKNVIKAAICSWLWCVGVSSIWTNVGMTITSSEMGVMQWVFNDIMKDEERNHIPIYQSRASRVHREALFLRGRNTPAGESCALASSGWSCLLAWDSTEVMTETWQTAGDSSVFRLVLLSSLALKKRLNMTDSRWQQCLQVSLASKLGTEVTTETWQTADDSSVFRLALLSSLALK